MKYGGRGHQARTAHPSTPTGKTRRIPAPNKRRVEPRAGGRKHAAHTSEKSRGAPRTPENRAPEKGLERNSWITARAMEMNSF